MTAMHDTNPDPLWSFLNALPPRVRNRVNRTGRLYTLVHAAVVEHGWTPQALAAECARNQDRAVVNPGGIVMHRLEAAAQHGPAEEHAARVHDGCCEQGWIYDETTIPPTVTKCPGKSAEPPSGTPITRNLPSSQGGRNTDHTQLTAQSTEI